MAQEALPERGARLGRARGAAGAGRTVRGVVLLLPDGEVGGVPRPGRLTATGLRPLARRLVRVGLAEGLTTHLVHYRRRGGDDPDPGEHPAEDARWAVAETVRRYGDVPVCLAGHGTGGRAALLAAGHPAVAAVIALAPWLPPADAAAAPDPVKQLVGRQVLIAHGTNDRRTDPQLSYQLAERAKKANRDVCRFEVHSDGHGLHQHRPEVLALAVDFVLGSLFGHDFSRPVTDALAAPPPLGLRMPLAAGFGATLPR